jgi:hypothetical protein
MEKKESLKKALKLELPDKKKTAKGGGRIFAVIKFLSGVLLLPFVYSVSVSFLGQFALVDKIQQKNFRAGLISLLILYLFVWEPAPVYLKGQQILETAFSFFKPLVKVAPYLLPIYAIILFCVYGLFTYIFNMQGLLSYFIFLFGFTIGLHIIFSAKSLRSKQEDFLKANYIFGFSFLYIVNVALLAFCLNLIFNEFSFVNFCNSSYHIAKGILSAVFRQLF